MKHNFRIYYSILLVLALIAFSKCYSTTEEVGQTIIDCNELIVSPIADQEMYENTRIYIPIASVTNRLSEVTFKISKGPTFIKPIATQRGRAELILDPTSEDVGSHNITVEVTDGKKKGCVDFEVKVNKIGKDKRVIHCDPNQKSKGSGTEKNPYPSLEILLDSKFVPMDNSLIILHEGNHGNVSISGNDYRILSSRNSSARLTGLALNNASNIWIKGVEIRPEEFSGMHDKYLVFIDSSSQNIQLTNSKITSNNNSQDWTIENWNESAARGIKCQAKNSIISNNLVQNVFHGIKTEGQFIQTNYNHVDRFGGDAIRNTGSNNAFNHNYLANATVDDYYDEDGNHDDLFQSWTFDKPVNKITLNNNIMISCIDTLIPLRSKIVQGLVSFDGFTTNWRVNNNLVVTDHPHGIALYGAENCIIKKNTVLKNPYHLYSFESDPWIMINNHKDGRKSKNNKVLNNVTTALNIVSADVEVSDNTVLDSISIKNLNNYYDWDFRIKK